MKNLSIHSALKDFFDVQVRQKQRAAEAEYKKIKMVKAMMMGISDGISSMFSKQQFQSKNHDLLLKQGYKWHDKPEHYTDATGRVISQEIEFNEKGHYFDGKHYRDANGNIVDDLYPHLKFINKQKENF